jgi:hypothetical protein
MFSFNFFISLLLGLGLSDSPVDYSPHSKTTIKRTSIHLNGGTGGWDINNRTRTVNGGTGGWDINNRTKRVNGGTGGWDINNRTRTVNGGTGGWDINNRTRTARN